MKYNIIILYMSFFTSTKQEIQLNFYFIDIVKLDDIEQYFNSHLVFVLYNTNNTYFSFNVTLKPPSGNINNSVTTEDNQSVINAVRNSHREQYNQAYMKNNNRHSTSLDYFSGNNTGTGTGNYGSYNNGNGNGNGTGTDNYGSYNNGNGTGNYGSYNNGNGTGNYGSYNNGNGTGNLGVTGNGTGNYGGSGNGNGTGNNPMPVSVYLVLLDTDGTLPSNVDFNLIKNIIISLNIFINKQILESKSQQTTATESVQSTGLNDGSKFWVVKNAISSAEKTLLVNEFNLLRLQKISDMINAIPTTMPTTNIGGYYKRRTRRTRRIRYKKSRNIRKSSRKRRNKRRKSYRRRR